MEIVELGALSAAQVSELEGDEPDPFDAAGVTLRYRAKDRHVAARDDDGSLIASAGLVLAEVSVAAERFSVVGLGGVIVRASDRGRGLARRIVEEALVRARAMSPPFVILFCHPDREGLYARLGFAELTVAVSVEQPPGFEPMVQRTMWRALRPGATWPAGDVVVHGLPF